jgi:PadR family transcriptional regulator, regulatory protein PadR
VPQSSDAKRDLFPGALEMMILQSVQRQPMHGYAMVQHIQQRSRDMLQVEEGSLYPALQRLLKGSLVEASWETSATNRRVRMYRITVKGESTSHKKSLASSKCSRESLLYWRTLRLRRSR